MASKGGFAGVARGVADAVVGVSRKAALLILDILDGLARAMENAHKEEERDAADAVQIDSKQSENERALIEAASDSREFDESGSLSTPCEAMLSYSLVLERLWPTGFSATKTKFFVLDEAGQEQYVVECVNYEKARKDNHATLYDFNNESLGYLKTKERRKGESGDEYLIEIDGDDRRHHLRLAYPWERPKNTKWTDLVYLLKPDKWFAVESVKEQFQRFKASLCGKELSVSMRIWEKDEMVMRITPGISSRKNRCYTIEARDRGLLLLGMMIAVATTGAIDHSEER